MTHEDFELYLAERLDTLIQKQQFVDFFEEVQNMLNPNKKELTNANIR